MNKAGGFITLHRQILDWEWYNDMNTFRLFVHILLTANYKNGKFEGRTIRRGQLVTSLAKLSTSSGLSIQQTRTALEHLISTGELTNESCAQYRIITVVKYNEYQAVTNQATSKQQTTNKPSNKQSTKNVPSNQQQYNNSNNINKETNKTKEQNSVGTASRFTPPTKEELFDFCLENQLGIDVDRFYDYYTSNGWRVGRNPMKDWKATVRNWAREKKDQPSRAAGRTVTAQEYTQRDYSSEDEAALRRMLEEV